MFGTKTSIHLKKPVYGIELRIFTIENVIHEK